MRRAYYGGTRKGYKKRKRRKRRDWHRSEFNNPFFSQPKTISLKPYLYFLLISLAIFGCSYFFLIFDYWHINSIVIETKNQAYREKAEELIHSALDSKVLKVLNGSNYFLFNSDDIKTKIENELLVKNLEIDKQIPNKVVVNFNEIVPSYIWIQGEKFYNVDEDGMILDEIISLQHEFVRIEDDADDESNDGFSIKKIKKFLQNSDADLYLPIIYDESGLMLKRREFIKNNEVFQFVSDLNSKITHNIEIDIILYKINTDNFKRVEIVTESGWKIFFSTDNDLSQQYENLYTLMQETFKNSEPSEYIDLRYGNKVYYK
jgi:cell division septal protein FtsQ